ncbi:MAG: DUF3427 domain-containing protein [Microbacterium sp.]
MDRTLEQLRLDNSFGFFDNSLQSDQVFHPMLIANDGANTMLRAIRNELRRSLSFTFSTAFVTTSAIAMLKQALLDFPGKGRVITSTYLGFNSPAAFRELLNIPGVDVFVYAGTRGGFHAKGYLFEQANSTTAIVGSSNLTESALLTNHEWNLRFSALPDGDIVDQLRRAVDGQLAASTPLTQEWIDMYAATYVPPAPRSPALRINGSDASLLPPGGIITPNAMQNEALSEIQKLRDSGERRAVIVSATGTGKTILSALDVRSFKPRRMLFVVHREQILDRAIEEFSRVLGAQDDEFGKFVGSRRDLDRKYVFGTIQSLSIAENLSEVPPGHFDYVLIDEVHRAGAGSYRKLIDHLKPHFLLGMTATPERTDGFNVFELFDFNVPYEIRLQQALEEDMLSPFHYYGVTDFIRDDEVIDEASQLSTLVAPERVDHIIAAIEKYGHVGSPARGLIFCSRKDEARDLVALLNDRRIHGRTVRTTALTGQDSIEVRESVVRQLEAGELDYIVTVDVFNEGIDIPSVNQVVMLRQTKSSIIFTQQLGRGLRKAAGKDHLIVIDFIGNYANNYLIPIALFGDNSLNKDSIRKKIMDSQEAGAISGLSSVNFDEISRERIFRSLRAAKLNSLKGLKLEVSNLANRLGRAPDLLDFARYDTADPVVVATTSRNYWELLHKLNREDNAPTPEESAALTYFSREILNGKRPHELLILRELMSARATVSQESLVELLRSQRCATNPATLRSAKRVLTQEFYQPAKRAPFGGPLVRATSAGIDLTPHALDLLRNPRFAHHLADLVETGLYISRHKYSWSSSLRIGSTYSRKDACRLLNWERNEEGVINGYKMDSSTGTCPIFVTYEKHEDVSEATDYGDEFLNEGIMHWYSRSNRTLRSAELAPIISNDVDLHLFVKKEDGEGSDHYYVGPVSAYEPRQAVMPRNSANVVTMSLALESPLEKSLYDYLVESGIQPAS